MITDASDLFARIAAALAPTYALDRPVGAGGMAVVYLATDLKHDRRVALKLLHPDLAATVSASRFVREIRFAARLTHPHILPLLDSGEVEGIPYYVMPFVEGESLRVRLAREHTIPVAEAVTLTMEVADALNYAHAAGIVHRDIKPDNILILGAHAIVADFGIARAIRAASDDEEVTTVGLTVGTPAYVSPEQAAGDEHIDGRSDIYSLACVLFESIAGTPPFTGKSAQAVIAHRFTAAAPRLSALCGGLDPHLDVAIAAALEMDPDDRPATAADFSRALQVSQVRPARGAHGSGPAGSVAVTRAEVPVREVKLPSIAVLPFANLSADPANEYFSDGITEEVINALSRLRTVRLAARSSSFAFKGKHEDVRIIAEKLGVTTILDGSVRRAGSRVRVRTELIDARSGYKLWSEQIERELDDVFQMQDEIAHAIASALKVTLLGGAYSHSTAVAGVVYETYLRGRFALRTRVESEVEQAVRFFSEAAAQDDQFALAPAGLADALLVLGVYGARPANEVMPLARDAARRALAINPSLAEAYTTLGAEQAVHEWNWAASEDAFRRAIALDPQYPTAHQWFAMNCLTPQRRFDEAIASAERARILDPASPVLRATTGVVRHLAGDHSGALADFERAIELDDTFAMSHYFLGNVYRDLGEWDRSVVAYESAIARSGVPGGTPEMEGGLAQSLAKRGHLNRARSVGDALRASASTRHVSHCVLAQVAISLGEIPNALSEIEHAFLDREPELIYLGVRPVYVALVGEPRYQEFCHRIGLP